MKKIRLYSFFLVLFMVLSASVTCAAAETSPELIAKSSNALVKLDLLRGDQNGNLKLGDNITRCEFVTLIIRMLGLEDEVQGDGVKMDFNDFSEEHWSYNNMKTALKYELIEGYPENVFKPDNNVTYAEALTVLVRALGYENNLEGQWPENVITKSEEIGICQNINLESGYKITRGEASLLIYNSLTVNFNR